jgi:hypothetical protein
MRIENDDGMILTRETEELGKTRHSAVLSTTNPTQNDLGANPGLRGESSATNRRTDGTAD